MNLSRIKIVIIVLTATVIIAAGFWFYQTGVEQTCILSGGSIKTSLCCKLGSDFPNACSIGACGCSPSNSRQTKTCDCGEDKCFNGHVCVSQ